jgi:hypothetical protein
MSFSMLEASQNVVYVSERVKIAQTAGQVEPDW